MNGERIGSVDGIMANTRSRAAAAALVVALAACGGGQGQGPEQSDAGEPGARVLTQNDVADARLDTLLAGVVVTGTLDPYLTVDVKSQVPGVARDLRVDRGDSVGRGDRLLRIEAAGILGMAASARAGVTAARAQLALADRQRESARQLYEAGAISQIEFQQAQAGYEAAQAGVAAAEAQAASAGESAGRAMVDAPIAGVISDRQINEGEAVNPGQSLLTVVNTTQLELAGRVGVEEAVQIRRGLPVEFRIDGYPGRVFRGSVARIEPTADPASRQVGVWVRLPNEGGLVGGLYATGRILTGGESQVLTVPVGALRGTDAEPYVWAVEGGRIARRPVQVGARSGGRAAIESGLDVGATVVVTPGEIEDGTPVTIRPAPGGVSGEEQ